MQYVHTMKTKLIHSPTSILRQIQIQEDRLRNLTSLLSLSSTSQSNSSTKACRTHFALPPSVLPSSRGLTNSCKTTKAAYVIYHLSRRDTRRHHVVHYPMYHLHLTSSHLRCCLSVFLPRDCISLFISSDIHSAILDG